MSESQPYLSCDGSFRCPASEHIEGCYTGEGHPDAQPSAAPEERPQHTWTEEQIEAWLEGWGFVYVFRHVPEYGLAGEDHPSFEEWLAAMKAAGEGLDVPHMAHREVYGVVHYGVAGHRPWTGEERAERIAYLNGEVERNERLLAGVLPPVATPGKQGSALGGGDS